jgi:hypothetical protein
MSDDAKNNTDLPMTLIGIGVASTVPTLALVDFLCENKIVDRTQLSDFMKEKLDYRKYPEPLKEILQPI